VVATVPKRPLSSKSLPVSRELPWVSVVTRLMSVCLTAAGMVWPLRKVMSCCFLAATLALQNWSIVWAWHSVGSQSGTWRGPQNGVVQV
jgi:hypothetical protein